MNKKPVVKSAQNPRALIFSNHIVTLSEACILCGKSRTAILHALHKGKIKGRGSFTGGEWLVDYPSLIHHYGLRYDVWQSVQSGCQPPSPETTDA